MERFRHVPSTLAFTPDAWHLPQRATLPWSGAASTESLRVRVLAGARATRVQFEPERR